MKCALSLHECLSVEIKNYVFSFMQSGSPGSHIEFSGGGTLAASLAGMKRCRRCTTKDYRELYGAVRVFHEFAIERMRVMRAMVLPRFGGPELFEMHELERPEPGPGEVLVHVLATAVNPVDAKLRANGAWAKLDPPVILGYDVAGIVEVVGPGVTDFRSGERETGGFSCNDRGRHNIVVRVARNNSSATFGSHAFQRASACAHLTPCA